MTMEVNHRERLQAAIRLVDSGRLREAEDVFRHLLRDAPDDPDAICGLAGVAIVRGEPQAAFDLLRQARERHPRHDGVLCALGSAHQALGRPAEAMVCVEAAIGIAPENAAHRLVHLQLLLAEGRTDEALKEADLGLKLAGDMPDLLNAKGTVLIALGRREEGVEMFRRAHKADPERADAAHNLALALATLGLFEEAVPVAERAYLNEPGNPSYRVSFARRLVETGQLERARDVAQAAVAIAPGDVATNETLSTCLVLMGEEEKALANLASLVRRVKGSAEPSLALARVLRLAGRFEQALEAVAHARSIAPQELDAVTLEREIALTLGRYGSVNTDATRLVPSAVSTSGVDVADVIFCARWLTQDMKLHCGRGQADLFAGFAEVIVESQGSEVVPVVALMDRIAEGPSAPTEWKPYLEASDEKRAKWTDALSKWPRPHIGLLWEQYPPEVGLTALRSAVDGFGTMISLATGPLRQQLEGHADILDAGAHIETLSDLAAAIAAMDVIVASDSVAAHLAGALGKRGIILVSAGHAWPWRSQDGCSVWYPTLAVVKATRAGQWDKAIVETTARLEQLVPQIMSASASQ